MTVQTTSPLPAPTAVASVQTAPPPPAAPIAVSPGERTPRPGRSTVPRRIVVLATVALVTVALLFGVTAVGIGNAREGLTVIGHDAGPQVVATADLYFALSDMDAQVANVLLVGAETGLGKGRAEALRRYNQRRAEASRAVLQAAELALGNSTEEESVRAVLDGLGRYERLASQAILLDEQSRHAAGPPPRRVIELYREATDLMRLDLLPKAYNLTLESGTIVRRTYEEESAAVRDGRILVGVTGLAAVVVLVGLQTFLARRFRRVTNPALLLATAVVATFTLFGMVLLGEEAEHLRTAKEDGFTSVLALSRARAIGNTMHGDQSRYLLDPERADVYEQVYLEKSQSVLYTPSGNLDAYYAGVDKAVSSYPERFDFLGFYGTEAANVKQSSYQAALERVLDRYQRFQRQDRQMRAMAVEEGRLREAIVHCVGPLARSFEEYDKALVDLTAAHRATFERAIADGDDALAGWNLVLPGGAVLVALLILAGVAPRLSEYR